jgi:hypothetical protein
MDTYLIIETIGLFCHVNNQTYFNTSSSDRTICPPGLSEDNADCVVCIQMSWSILAREQELEFWNVNHNFKITDGTVVL